MLNIRNNEPECGQPGCVIRPFNGPPPNALSARKADAADTVPLATTGLAVTALGTVVGLVGSLLTVGG